MDQPILEMGRNCWRIERAARVTPLIDADAFYHAFCQALERAERSVMLLGWEINTQTALPCTSRGTPDTPLAEVLAQALAQNPKLQIRILMWDFALIYAMERELLAGWRLSWRARRRLTYRVDNRHPFGASHHQKVIVIDDKVAFSGGLDISKCRWDTRAHLGHDPRRTDPAGVHYQPFHDVQIMVDGEAARALGDLARARWERATGQRLKAPRRLTTGDPWPPDYPPWFEDVEVAIARTQAVYGGDAEIREVERLFSDSIARASRWIYFENQYFTSRLIELALTESLQREDGPEIVMVLPRHSLGWMEQHTMDVLRARLLRRLTRADRHGRLRLYHPVVPELGDQCFKVHAKVTIVDDRLARIGSANLSNRSMGLDSECDLAIEARPEQEVLRGRIADLRNDLLAEHLGVETDEVARTLHREGSLIQTVERLRRGERTLAPLDYEVPPDWDREVPEDDIVDPHHPLAPEEVTATMLPQDQRRTGKRRGLGFALLIAGVLALAALWRWTPLADYVDFEAMQAWLSAVQGHPLAPAAVIGAFVVLGVVAVPLTALVAVTVLIFGPFLGFTYALTGSLASASAGYAIGSWGGSDFVRRFAGARIRDLSEKLGQRGILMMITVRVLPVAPFLIINLVAGASHIRFRDYLIGTTIGMVPGLLALAVFIDRIEAAIRDPGLGTLVAAIVVGVLVVAALLLVRRWLGGQPDKQTA
ncbi:VTT domain-containing protein [Ectothiorhodospiraceae bacterium 2226]|nr:VTT domain-containing protein [Ectothiorhodospiraceae bacterium 2226]